MDDSTYIGMTFYGGVSLAVFEAGVAYEMVRAVQFSRHSDLPDLHVDVISGTSAGGLTAVQLAAALSGRNPDKVLGEMIFMWANTADITNLFPGHGFEGQGVLDNKVLKDGIGKLLKMAAEGGENPLEEELDFILTVTNFSGLREPVFLPQDGGGFRATELFPTTRHCEYDRFKAKDVLDLKRHEDIVLSSAATAGFPVAFPPTMKNSLSLPQEVDEKFIYIDGGVKDNWPLGVALDTIRNRPAPKRKYYFIDPSETYRVAEMGHSKEGRLHADPISVLSIILNIARADSIYWDMEELRRSNDRQKILEQLSKRVFKDEELRQTLEKLHKNVAQQDFNKEARSLWLMIENLVSPKTEELWNDIHNIPRFILRARANEYLALMHEEREVDKDLQNDIDQLKKRLNLSKPWKAYYEAVETIGKHGDAFRNLRYEVWQQVYRASDGRSMPQDLPDGLEEKIRKKLEELLRDTQKLERIREDLAEAFFKEVDISRDQLEPFYIYAKAMQVLESLAGLKYKGTMDISRITPFDLYTADEKLREQKPLAGGALGAFGGFLDKGWRINDFLVGRLAMRQRLKSERLIPSNHFDNYLEFVNDKDQEVIQSLKAGSMEKEKIKKLIELPHKDQGPYDNDEKKPEDLLLGKKAMALENIEPKLLTLIPRRVSRSLRGLFRRNKAPRIYNWLKSLNPILFVSECVAWLFEKTLLIRSTSVMSSYLRVLFIGILLGLVIGYFLR